MKITVEVYENQMVLTANGKTIAVKPSKPFASTRLLVGTFISAVEGLKEGLSKVGATGFLKS